MPSRTSIAVLLLRVAQRDVAAFDALYRKSSPRLYSICLRILNNKADADDALQDAFVKIWLRADQFRATDGSADAWLHAVARYVSIDKIRSRKRMHLELDDIVGLADQAPGPEISAIVKNDNTVLHGFLDQLDPAKAAAVRGAYMNGETYLELSEKHGVPLNTMRTWLRRSLMHLRRSIEERDNSEGSPTD